MPTAPNETDSQPNIRSKPHGSGSGSDPVPLDGTEPQLSNAPRKRARKTVPSKISKNRRSPSPPDATASARDRVPLKATEPQLSNLLTLQPSTASHKRARKTTPAKISKFQRPPTLAQLAKAAWTNIPEPSGKLVKRIRTVHRDGYVSRLPTFEWRWSTDPNYFESPRTRAVI
ncbi:MAG: hypothetical protein ACREDR_32395, partial [Blastocatellia bacterium]